MAEPFKIAPADSRTQSSCDVTDPALQNRVRQAIVTMAQKKYITWDDMNEDVTAIETSRFSNAEWAPDTTTDGVPCAVYAKAKSLCNTGASLQLVCENATTEDDCTKAHEQFDTVGGGGPDYLLGCTWIAEIRPPWSFETSGTDDITFPENASEQDMDAACQKAADNHKLQYLGVALGGLTEADSVQLTWYDHGKKKCVFDYSEDGNRAKCVAPSKESSKEDDPCTPEKLIEGLEQMAKGKITGGGGGGGGKSGIPWWGFALIGLLVGAAVLALVFYMNRVMQK